jgi:hypothetical protein
MSRLETSPSSGEAIVEEVDGDDRRCNADSAIIEVQLPTVALLDAHVSLIDALLHRNLLFRGLPY